MAARKIQTKWYHQPKWAAMIAVGALGAAYGVGSRSLDTGSWQQYFLTLSFLILGLNRMAHLAKLAFKHRKAAA